MGALFGWTGPAPASPALIRARLSHRGGSMASVRADGRCELAVLAAQPDSRVAEAEGVSLAFDGVVYGVDVGVASDIEHEPARCLLSLYLARGLEFMDGIDGEYALALYDSRSGRLLLARDRTGVHPLHYAFLPDGRAFFASEYKALLAAEAVPAVADREMVQRLQRYKHLPVDRTLLRDVHPVRPGSLLDVTSAPGRIIGGQSRVRFAIERRDLEATSAAVADAFLRSARDRARGAQRIGVSLSGGIDSIAVAFACRKFRPEQPLLTFSAGSGPEDPEIRTAAIVSERLAAEHHVVYVTPADIAHHLESAIWHVEDPISRSELVQFYCLGREAQGKVDLLLAGNGSDGLFAGMPSDKVLWAYNLLPPLRRPLLEFYAHAQAGRVPHGGLGRLLSRMYFRSTVPSPPQVVGLSPGEAELPQLPSTGAEFLNRFLCEHAMDGLAQRMPKVERMFSAFGVELGGPFFERRLVNLAFTIPDGMKLRRLKEKYILRKALRSIVPPDLLAIPKFPMRMTYDDVFADALDGLADRYLADGQVAARGLLEPASVRALRGYRKGGRYHPEGAMRLWTAVATELWARHFVDRRGQPS